MLVLTTRVFVPRVYTQGTILIAVNPLRKVDDPEMSEFMNRALDPESPHPYAIAEVRLTTVYLVPGIIYLVLPTY